MSQQVTISSGRNNKLKTYHSVEDFEFHFGFKLASFKEGLPIYINQIPFIIKKIRQSITSVQIKVTNPDLELIGKQE